MHANKYTSMGGHLTLPVAQVHRLHLLITASTLRRPLIVFENVDVSAVGEGSPDSLEGLYLPGGLHVGLNLALLLSRMF